MHFMLNLQDQEVPHTADPVVIALPATDTDGETVTYTVELLQSGAVDPLGELAFNLDQQLNLRYAGSYSENWGRIGERWMQSDAGWHFITPDGSLYRWTGVASIFTHVWQQWGSLTKNARTRTMANW